MVKAGPSNPAQGLPESANHRGDIDLVYSLKKNPKHKLTKRYHMEFAFSQIF